MIIDTSIKKCILNNINISKIYKDNIPIWHEDNIITTVMAPGPTLNNIFNKRMTAFILAEYNIPIPDNAIDISEAGDGTIVTWYDLINGIQYYKPIGVVEKVLLNPDSSYMFDSCTLLTTISSKLDTSKVVNMYCMFNECNSLAALPELNTSKVTDMYCIFNGCSTLTTIPILDTSNVTNMCDVFRGCGSLVYLDLSYFDTSKVTNMYGMFSNCHKLSTIIYGEKFINDVCVNFEYMYLNCPANKPPNWNGTWNDVGTFVKNI